jgi:hypothetical protein
VLVSKSEWISLLHLVLFKVEPRLNPRFGGVDMAHLLLLVFRLTGAQWRLHTSNEVPVVLLGDLSRFNCTYPLF